MDMTRLGCTAGVVLVLVVFGGAAVLLLGTRDSPAPACVEPKRVALMGDSTRDEHAAGVLMVDALRAELPDATVKSFGMNGMPLDRYLGEPVQDEMRSWRPDVVEVSIGINDLRLDQSTTRASQFKDDLGSYLDDLHRDLPEAQVIASVPAALSARDIGGVGYVQPPAAADVVTHELHDAYLEIAAARPWLTLNDVQAKVTGTSADDSMSPRFTTDQVHPNEATATKVAALIADALRCRS